MRPSDAEDFINTCLQSQQEPGLATHERPHFVQPYSDGGRQEIEKKRLPTRPHFQEYVFAQYSEKYEPDPLSPVSPGPSGSTSFLAKEEDVGEMRYFDSHILIDISNE